MHRNRLLIAAIIGAVTMLAACGGDSKQAASPPNNGQPTAAVTPTPGPQATATGTATVIDWTRLEKYIPADKDLPDRVSYQSKIDLSNEAAANDQAQLKQFQDSGRLGGIQFFFSVEAGARTISVGVSYYNNPAEPKKLLRESGDPANPSGQGRFTVAGLGDEHVAQRGTLGSGEAAVGLILIGWTRGPFFVSLADLGGTASTSPDAAIKLAQLVDERIKAAPRP